MMVEMSVICASSVSMLPSVQAFVVCIYLRHKGLSCLFSVLKLPKYRSIVRISIEYKRTYLNFNFNINNDRPHLTFDGDTAVTLN